MNLFTSAYADACSQIGLAARSGSVENLQKLLSDGCDYAVKDNRGWFPMHEASYHGHLQCVKILLDAAQKDCENVEEILECVFPSAYDRSTPLSLAASRGYWEIVKVLAPIYAECKHKTEGFPLHKACEIGCLKCVQAVVEILPDLVNSSDVCGGNYPLHIAVEEGNVPVALYLLQNRADVNAKDLDDGKTPLCVAVFAGNLELVKLLANHGGDVNARDSAGCTPLYLASQQGHTDIVNALLELNADASIGMQIDGPSNLTSLPISIAAAKGHLGIVERLIAPTKLGNSCDTSSAVTFAALFGQADCLRTLLDANFSAFSLTTREHRKKRWQEIVVSEIDNRAEIVQILIDSGTVIEGVSDLVAEIINCGNATTVIFLNSGLTELQYLCHIPPNVSSFAATHACQGGLLVDQVKYENYLRVLFSKKYLPYATMLTGATDSVAERKFTNTTPVQVIPRLDEMCRWLIRCLLVRRFGLVNNHIITRLRLPKMVNEFLLYKS